MRNSHVATIRGREKEKRGKNSVWKKEGGEEKKGEGRAPRLNFSELRSADRRHTVGEKKKGRGKRESEKGEGKRGGKSAIKFVMQ